MTGGKARHTRPTPKAVDPVGKFAILLLNQFLWAAVAAWCYREKLVTRLKISVNWVKRTFEPDLDEYEDDDIVF